MILVNSTRKPSDSKKQSDQRKKEQVKQMRKIDEFADTLRNVVDEQKEKWRQELQDIEQRRNDLLPEHLKTQKRSLKLQCLQDRQKQCQKNMGGWAEENEHPRSVIEDSRARIEGNGQKIQSESLAQAELDLDIKCLQAGYERRGASQSTAEGVCTRYIQAFRRWEPRGWRPPNQEKVGGPKGGRGRRVGARRVGAEGGRAKIFALFFPSTAPIFALFFLSLAVFSCLFFSLWGSSRGILVVFEAPGPSNVHVWALGLSCPKWSPPVFHVQTRTRPLGAAWTWLSCKTLSRQEQNRRSKCQPCKESSSRALRRSHSGALPGGRIRK